MTKTDLEDLIARATLSVAIARTALGRGLLEKADDVPLRRKRLLETERELADAELMLEAYDAWQQERATVRAPRVKAPRVSKEAYGRARRAFQADYTRLKGTPALAARALELLQIAKASGQFAVDDCKSTLRSFGGSPELARLLPNDN